MNNSTIVPPSVAVHENQSGLEDRLVEHKVLGHGFRKGFHLLLFQNRYGDGTFLVDWQACKGIDNWDAHARRNWNVLVEMK